MPSTFTSRLEGLTTSVAVKAPCRVATTAAITLSGLQTIDGVALSAGDRVLVKNQSSAIDNGIWIASVGAWTRAADFDGTLDAVGGTQAMVLAGSANGNTYWRVDGVGDVDVGQDGVEFSAALINDSATLSFVPPGTGVVTRTVQDRLRDFVSLLDFDGADPTGTTDSLAALEAWEAYCRTNGKLGCAPFGSYRISDTFEMQGGVSLHFDRVIIKKAFTGVGLRLSGGSNYNDLYGHLTVTRNSSVATGSGSGATTGDTGIVINSRVRQFGTLISEGHQADGILIVADTNLNRSHFDCVLSQANNGYGITGSGTSDNVASWKAKFHARSNYKSGFYLPDTFPARAWDFVLHCEGNASDLTSDECYTGGLNYSRMWVYSEKTTATTGVELNVPAATDHVEIFNARPNTETVNAVGDVVIHAGGEIYVVGTTGWEGHVRASSLTDNASRYTRKQWIGNSGAVLAERRVFGSGKVEHIVYDRSGTNDISQVLDGEFGPTVAAWNTSGKLRFDHYGSRGTKASPATVQAGDIIYEEHIGGYEGAANVGGMRVRATVSAVSSGKISLDYVVAMKPDAGSSYVDTWKIHENGDVEVMQVGLGVILTSPNGTRYRLSVSNAGAAVFTGL